ncbi:3-hydroxyacyl-ACP dehydratase [Flavobacterium psychrophilum]|uniref:3-hydroxyacyl-ACP dehydratase n=1 Tax=Flavobacterium psychrophilum TaxID=96345 RepID=UPI000B7C1072|nr:3-hydroxyacyl-ACP dehydratase [Flavobacterium psychrophilum]EKT3957437.1 3-hydroxyacyl-ACP dehydratase [Flavobacterium psychrophilum]EKT4498884.1 3-hydroxyacyl-ACP dehydratase [Flavobacterium psychrophilum]EKT4509333.1 3-hydroxyacyl-ACP dehydratase [Flavobacterium psychrophilum]EKT4549707.1 3-hydroxyacyl-ACP dehydratase [Flavobacterium psychrophilum]ELI6454944.1 3-hydroxyacyl-ACP dehydratase [Flavobacterium psychrophilum]
MLLKDFYKVISLEKNDSQKYLAIILVNEKHEVFKGHFPGNPIMPGVCMMQIIKEITEQITERLLIMQSLTNVKFMALINPEVTPELRLELDITVTDDGLVKVKNTTYFNQTVALKLSSVYKKV